MKLDAISAANAEKIYQNNVTNREQDAGTYTVGQVIEGVVTDVKDKVSIDFSGRELRFPKESVPDARKGQVRRFQVVEAGKNGIKLKEITSNNNTSTLAPSGTLKVDRQPVIADCEASTEEEEEQEQAEEVAERITKDDYKELAEEGFTLEGFNLKRLARALERIKAGKEQKAAANTAFAEKKKTERENIKKVSEELRRNQIVAGNLVDLLVSADLPVTDAKVRELAKAAMQGLEAVGSIGDPAKAYLIRNNLEPNIQNLYMAAHSGSSREQPLSDQVWEELRPAAQEVAKNAGLEMDEGLENARWLLENDLPLTAENLVYKAELDELSDNASAVSQDIVVKVLEEMAAGRLAQGALLARGPQELSDERAAKAASRDFAGILPETIDVAAARLRAGKSMQELSLAFLKKVQQELEGLPAQKVLTDTAARRQLEEIRLKLTTEAGMRLIRQGIRLDTSGLDKIVEGLRAIEQEYYKKLYEETGGAAAGKAGDVELLARTSQAVEDLKQAPANVLSVTFTTRTAQTLNSLHETGNILTAQYRQAQEEYEALMTKPRADMGDSIRTAFRNVDSLLEGLGVEATEANCRAVRMLSYNNLELTHENLAAMKQYDAQVQEMFERMNPAACAALIKKGINPLDMPLSELSETLQKLADEEGATTEEKYSAYLVMLDEKKELSPKEREAYIGIYRLLNQIAKTDGAAVGAVAGAGRELTLSAMLSAVRTRKKGGVDTAVDHEFGGVSASARGKSISDQIEAAYQQTMAQKAVRSLTPEALDAAGGPEKAMEMTPEELTNQLVQAQNEAAVASEAEQYAQAKVDGLVQTAAASSAEQAFLSSYGQEPSIASIRAAREVMSNRSIHRSVAGLAARYGVPFGVSAVNIASLENAEKMGQAVENWGEAADKVIDQIFENTALTGEDSEKLLVLRGAIRLSGRLAKQECYEIPISGEDGIVKLNLTIVHSGGASGRASIRMAGSEETKFEISLEGKKLNCYITTASRQELDRIQGREEAVKSALKGQGFEIVQWNYGLDTRSVASAAAFSGISAQEVPKDNAEVYETRTDDLYLAAKTMIQGTI